MDDDGGEREETRESEKPVDLTRERESFVRQFIRRGVELTEGLLEENERLRTRIEQLQEQNGLLRAQIASDDAIRDLLRKIETLESDLRRADLERVNLQTEYLNQRIAERAFSWNLLFDDLVGVMPRQVRVPPLTVRTARPSRWS